MPYNRETAVAYAERWWNRRNPEYISFEFNCTNYVSQCLRAGGAPIWGYPYTERGWWYVDHLWSLSWSVAHALYWYLRTSTTGLQAQIMALPEELMPGDIICYDFDGDGRWQHNAIVVAKDDCNMPLVNANTYDTRMHYWAYDDETGWEMHARYAFFHIYF